MTVLSLIRPVLLGEYRTDEGIAATLPVSSKAGVTYRPLLRLVIPTSATAEPVQPGDFIEVVARARVTNDTAPPYTVGVGYHVWVYDVDDQPITADDWVKISPDCGDNVSRDRHHMPLLTTAVWQVPSTWVPGHRPAVFFRGDAHSTAADGQSITVDQEYGELIIKHLRSSA